MAIDITKFHQTYFEESLEGLDLMESGLLELEGGSEDNEAINTIFRAAHSIKGGAGTLGFTAVAEFTHLVETLLDRRRSGRAELTQTGIDTLLGSVDCLRDMLTAARDHTEVDFDRIAEVERQLNGLLGGDAGAGAGSTHTTDADAGEAGAETATPTAAAALAGAATTGTSWRVAFNPHTEIFRSGNDPVRILGELSDLADPGTYRVVADTSALPELENLDVEASYCRWTIELEGPTQEADILQVFEWVADEADITIEPVGAATVAVEPTTTSTDTDGAPNAEHAEAADTTDGAERRGGSDRRQTGDQHGAPATSTSIRVDIEKIDTLINMVGELVITQSMLQELAGQGSSIDLDKFREGLADLERNTRELQGSVMQIRMLPISFAFSRLPRLVRDLASKLGKTVALDIHGETTELDKTVMEKIGDPLVHLVRNALDHGIETPEVRVANGKSETARVSLSAYHEGGNIVIEISDDGAGLNSQRILAKARERGLIGDDDQLSERQIHDLIFQPGFSTAETVSDVSGRGVGMDVVKRNINDLGGVIEVESNPGQGSTFRIRLPLTLAILDGQVVRVGDQVFIVPLVSIVESIQFDTSLTGALAKGARVFRHRGATIPIVELNQTFGIDAGTEATGPQLLVVVEAEGTRAGLVVDDLLAQQQIVIKSLKTNFRPVPGLSGATILGDGTVAMILDVNSVLALFRQTVPTLEPVA